MRKKTLAIIATPLFLVVILASGCIILESPELSASEDSYQYVIEPSPTPSLEEQKISICEEVAQQYYETHTYVQNDVFDCDNMACDVWNMLKTKGINAKIAVGNVDLDECGIEDWNHAWVMAEVSPNTWLAIECTGGYVVYENPRYYHGHGFNNPKSLRDFNQLYKEYQIQLNEYNNAINFYNALVNEYNNAGYFTQLSLESGLQVAKLEMDQKERKVYTTKTKLEAVLEYG
ncbi:MAG: hypothetical protein FFODKBPE_00150 [Candidatus Argoarchaeum ethanivorans]|uniref:Transglutaminase-like domain-containing protein n=1 Tax=Candidatus Argoarchaeum ethanivorans TaxID=2608793 RepID=A0A811T6D3_9EURY|nr:MAG: hypothetical protein FFODKBPE_00150 [Candidatus Argoarchaeum ethanivorans]